MQILDDENFRDAKISMMQIKFPHVLKHFPMY